MKRCLIVRCASVILVTALTQALWADDDDGGPLTSPVTGITREFTLNMNVVPDHEVRPGVPNDDPSKPDLGPSVVQLWAFACRDTNDPLMPNCGPAADPTLPGPVLRVTKGDLVRLTFKNTHAKPHTIHLHGYHRNNVDGVHPVPPHENFLIEMVANPCGSYVYHCHINTPLHQDRGMYGQFVVDCPDSAPEEAVEHEFLLVLDEQPRDWPALGDDPFPETHEYIINGKAFVPDSVYSNNNLKTIYPDGTVVDGPMVVNVGDRVRLRVSSFGMANHEMELVGPLPSMTVQDMEIRQGSNPVLDRPASIAEPPPEIVTNHTLTMKFTAGAAGTYLFRSTNPVERKNYERLPDGTLLMGAADQGGMQTVLVVE